MAPLLGWCPAPCPGGRPRDRGMELSTGDGKAGPDPLAQHSSLSTQIQSVSIVPFLLPCLGLIALSSDLSNA